MLNRYTIVNLNSPSRGAMQWFLHLGGLGLIPLGLLDGSLFPILPGSMDIATILLAAHDKKLWFYYAAMATAGSVLGGFRRDSKVALFTIFFQRHSVHPQMLVNLSQG